MKNGVFITIEGMEAAGKSTQIPYLSQYLQDSLAGAGKILHTTREPGGTLLGEQIRTILLKDQKPAITNDAELLLMFAARAQHLEQVIRPALERGDWVVSDRFTDTTYAYQGGGRRIPISRIEALENLIQRGLRPDLTIILDLPVEVSMKRACDRGGLDRIELETPAFFERVRKTYLERVEDHPERYCIINAEQDIPDITNDIKNALALLLAESNINNQI